MAQRHTRITRNGTVTSRDSISFDGKTIEYEVRRTERRKKTVEITVHGQNVRVASPMRVPDSELRAFVRQRASWILRRLSEPIVAPAPKQFIDGETLPYLGRNLRMTFESADVRTPEVRFEHWRLRVTEPPGLVGIQRVDALRGAVMAWYYERAAQRLPETIDRWWPQLGHGPKPRVLIRNQKKRWASCAHDGTLRFNWRVMMLDQALIDYVVVHELAHLKVKNHSKDFWNRVQEAMPDSPQRRQRLREVAPTLPLWDA